MISLVGLTALGMGAVSRGIETGRHAQAIPTANDPRASGANFASSITADRQTIGARQPPKPVYLQPAPNTLRHHPFAPLDVESEYHRRYLMQQALPEGPWDRRGGRGGRDRWIEMNRVPYYHPGLTRVVPSFSGGPVPMRATTNII